MSIENQKMCKCCEKNLKKLLENFLNNFNANDINEYFANDFSDDWDIYLKDNIPVDILIYLNDAFCDIDIDYRDTDMFETRIKETLRTALELLERIK